MRMVINNMFVYHFVDPVCCEKDAAAEQGDVDFETGDWSTCCTLVLEVEGNFKQSLFFFWWPKRTAIKNSLDSCFHFVIICFDFPSCGSESRKTYTLSLLLMCLEAEGLEGGRAMVVVQPVRSKLLTRWKSFLEGLGNERKLRHSLNFVFSMMVFMRVSKAYKLNQSRSRLLDYITVMLENLFIYRISKFKPFLNL